MSLYRSTLEMLPDEMLLEICRYLHSGDVLYSFFSLNYRLNQTINFYCQHVSLHRTHYIQFNSIFYKILPHIQFHIRSLVIYELESPSFFLLFENNYIYYNLEKLTLVNWTDKKLILFLNTLHNMIYFHKLIIQALDLTKTIDNIILLKTIFSTNDNHLTHIIFDHECDPFTLTDNNDEKNICIFSNIIHLNIELQTTIDLIQLNQFIPNVEILNITFKQPWRKNSFNQQIFNNLTELSIYAMSWFSTYGDLKSLIQILPNIQNLSLVLVTHDYLLVNGQSVLSLISSSSSSIKQFHYSICYHSVSIENDFNPTEIIETWKSIPIDYSINESGKRIFLHTILYKSNRLSLRSLFTKQMSTKLNNNNIYRNVRHLHIYDTISLTETFGILQHCHNILDLVISFQTLSSKNVEVQKTLVTLPYLNRLDFLSIQGSPPDTYYLEKIFSISPNLSAIAIEFDSLYKLLNDDDQSLLLYYLFYKRIIILCIRFEDVSIDKLTNEHIHLISRIFFRVNHMCIDLRNSKILIQSDLILLILKYFPYLIVLSMYGDLSENISSNKDNLSQYLIENLKDRLINNENFQIDYGYERLKIWM